MHRTGAITGRLYCYGNRWVLYTHFSILVWPVISKMISMCSKWTLSLSWTGCHPLLFSLTHLFVGRGYNWILWEPSKCDLFNLIPSSIHSSCGVAKLWAVYPAPLCGAGRKICQKPAATVWFVRQWRRSQEPLPYEVSMAVCMYCNHSVTGIPGYTKIVFLYSQNFTCNNEQTFHHICVWSLHCWYVM